MQSFESILYQGKSNDLKSILIDRSGRAIEYCKADDYNKMVDELVLMSGDIKRITGMDLRVRVIDFKKWKSILGTPYSAYTDVKVLDRVSLFRKDYIEKSMTSGKSMNISQVLDGGVDYTTGRVSGVFTQIPAEIVLYINLLDGTLEAEELAAMIAHEVGHNFTNFSMTGILGVTTAFMGSMVDVFDRYATNEDIKVKVARSLVNTLDPNTKVDIQPNMEELAIFTMNNTDKIFTDYTGLGWKGMESLEYLADQYTSRLGLAGATAKALTKLSRVNSLSGKLRISASKSKHVSGLMGLLAKLLAYNKALEQLRLTENTQHIAKIVTGAVKDVSVVARSSRGVFFVSYMLRSFIMDAAMILAFKVGVRAMRDGRTHPTMVPRLESIKSDQIAILKGAVDERERNYLLGEIDTLDSLIDEYKSGLDWFMRLNNYLPELIMGDVWNNNQRRNLAIRQNNPLYELIERLRQE